MDEEKFWQLLSSKLTGEATGEELETFDRLLQQYPELGLQAQLMMQLWNKKNTPDQNTDDFFNRHLQRLSNLPDVYPAPVSAVVAEPPPATEKTIRRHALRWLLPALGIAASLLLSYRIFYTGQAGINADRKNGSGAKNTVRTRKGSKSNVQLPDGTIAWLNADSKLVYNENFRGELREVYLEGEAFFDVVKDKTRPFIIHTKTIDVRVLGTAFNVRAYETEKNTETSLFRGSVEVTLHNSPEKKIILKPNEKLMVNNKDLLVTGSTTGKEKQPAAAALNIMVGKVHFQPKDSSALETLWIKNKLVFDAESLEEVAQKIERWYDVQVVVNGDDDFKQTTYSGIFDNERLSEVMEALKMTGNIRYSIHKNVVTIR